MSESESLRDTSRTTFILVIIGSVVGTLVCIGCLTIGIFCIVRTIRPKVGGLVSTADGPVDEEEDLPTLDDGDSESFGINRDNSFMIQHHRHHRHEEKQYAKHHDKRQHDDLFKKTGGDERGVEKHRDDRNADKVHQKNLGKHRDRDDHDHKKFQSSGDERLEKNQSSHDERLEKPRGDEHDHLGKHHDKHQQNSAPNKIHEDRERVDKHHEKHHHHH